MSRRPKGLGLEIPAEEAASYRVDHDGAFVKGELNISQQGMKMKQTKITREKEVDDSSTQSSSQSSSSKSADIVHAGESTMILSDLIFGAKLGEGASSQVFRARHRQTGVDYAVKQISIGDKGRRHQILQELQTLSTTQCPSIIQFHAAFFTDGVISIVLELMDCGSIDAFISQDGRGIPEPELAYFARQMIDGLVYMRSKHQVHSDFGITSQLDSSTDGACDTFVGTSNYMSPERVLGGKYGYASDIWSIGLVLLECALGKYPYPASGLYLETMNNIVSGPIPTVPSKLNFSPEFNSFVAACLVKDPDKRSTAEQLSKHEWFNLPLAKSRSQLDMKHWIQTATSQRSSNLTSTTQVGNKSDAANDINSAFGDLTVGSSSSSSSTDKSKLSNLPATKLAKTITRGE